MSDNQPTTIGENELLPCKRCGEREGLCGANDGWFIVECQNCPRRTGSFRSVAEAITAWNRRKDGLGTVSVKPKTVSSENFIAVPMPTPYITIVIDGLTHVLMDPRVLREALSCLTSIGVEAGK